MNVILAGLYSLVILLSPGNILGNSIEPLSTVEYSLENRNDSQAINEVFRDNILLAIYRMREIPYDTRNVDWEAVREPFDYSFVLKPGEVFAFHDRVLPQYEGKVVKTMNSRFHSDEGYKSDGFLVGDGVCHLASFMNVAAREAGLDVYVPSLHNIAHIPDVSDEDGVSIYYNPSGETGSDTHNLYITNNKSKTIVFNLMYQDDEITLRITEIE